MIVFILVSVVSGILFGVLDALINTNPLAQKLYQAYKPIAKTSLNPIAGFLVDLVFGFIMAGIFLLLYNGLPGTTGLLKGLSYAGIMWFFRVVMQVASHWMMYTIPGKTLLYTLLTGLAEMAVLGILYGLALEPTL